MLRKKRTSIAAKTERVDEKVLEDRLSSLPKHLIDSILEHLPVRDAARTCVLSKTWINIWKFHPQLVFDKPFFDQQSQRSRKEIVDIILFLHSGPILKFHLFIPLSLNNYVHAPVTVAWIKHVCRNGVRNLKLESDTHWYQMPSSFFSCSRLTELSLSKCELDPPRKFRGFPNLTKVELVNVSIIDDMTFGSQVSRWELSRCSGVEHLECQFKHTDNLCTLVIVDSRKCDWEWFRFTSVSYRLVLVRLKPVSNVRKIISLDELLVNICHIYTLELCGSTLECLEPGRKSPATPMKNLKYLVFYDLKLSELRQISNAYYLIRSSPNLQHLTTHLVHKAAMDSANESCLASPHCMNRILDRLQSIEIHGVVGSISELHLIKFLLASSRTLKTITLKHEKTIFDPKTELEIIKKLLRLPRASATAEMIWT